jgi:predicted kinase
MLVIMAGLPATGKSTLARAVADTTGAIVLDKDRIRAALFPAELIEYSREQDDFVVRVMLKVAGWIVRRDASRIVIVDGRPFAKKYQLDQVIAFAEWIKTPWRIVECTCGEDLARERLREVTHVAADRDFDLYLRVKDEWEEITRPKLLLDTLVPVEELAPRAVAYIRDGRESKQTVTTEL